jgi:Rap1a immunity proteins
MKPPFLALLSAIALPLASTASPANAEQSSLSTGNGLLNFCRDESNRLLCTAFINGFHAGAMNASLVISMRESGSYEDYKKKYQPYCNPNNVDAEQLLDIVLKYIRDNPQKRHFDSGLLIIVALNQAFPCQGTQ